MFAQPQLKLDLWCKEIFTVIFREDLFTEGTQDKLMLMNKHWGCAGGNDMAGELFTQKCALYKI